MNHRINSDRTAAVAMDAHYLPMHTCPIAVKVLLLGAGGVATVGTYNGKDKFWKGWFPLPKVRKTVAQEVTC